MAELERSGRIGAIRSMAAIYCPDPGSGSATTPGGENGGLITRSVNLHLHQHADGGAGLHRLREVPPPSLNQFIPRESRTLAPSPSL
jgi:hypothetical protein